MGHSSKEQKIEDIVLAASRPVHLADASAWMVAGSGGIAERFDVTKLVSAKLPVQGQSNFHLGDEPPASRKMDSGDHVGDAVPVADLRQRADGAGKEPLTLPPGISDQASLRHEVNEGLGTSASSTELKSAFADARAQTNSVDNLVAVYDNDLNSGSSLQTNMPGVGEFAFAETAQFGAGAAGWFEPLPTAIDSSEAQQGNGSITAESHFVAGSNGAVLAWFGDIASGPATGSGVTTGSDSAAGSTTNSSGFVIDVIYDPSVANAPPGFTQTINAVVNYFESEFSNPITITIDVGYGEIDGQPLEGLALGESEAYVTSVSFAQLQSALVQNAQALGDTAAVASLESINPPSGQFWITTAEAQALGIAGASTTIDGYVGFSDIGGLFDYNVGNSGGTVPAAEYDFFGVVAHEFSEVMGRQIMGGQQFDGVPGYEALDLFDYSAPGVVDLSGAPGYASADGGITALANFNTNPNGDPGDWATTAGNDAFDAFSSPGAVNSMTAADITIMNLLGWTPSSSSISAGSGTTGNPSGPEAQTGSPAYVTGVNCGGFGEALNAGKVVSISLVMSGPVTVWGDPQLLLNNGGIANYYSGSGTNTLTFDYQILPGQNTADLQIITEISNGSTVEDANGNTANFSKAAGANLGVTIDTTSPSITGVSSAVTGAVVALGGVLAIEVQWNQGLVVSGTPTLQLNDGGSAIYNASQSQPSSGMLIFDYTAGSGQNTNDLEVTGISLPNGASITDPAGNSPNTNGIATNLGVIVETTPPSIIGVAASTSAGTIAAGDVIVIDVQWSEALGVNGAPTLELNDGGYATYDPAASNPATGTLAFSYTVESGQDAADLQITGIELPNGASIDNAVGYAASLTLSPSQAQLNVNVDGSAIEVSNGGTLTISSGASYGTIELGNGIVDITGANNDDVVFAFGETGGLEVDDTRRDPTSYSGSVSNFGAGDNTSQFIDLTSVKFSSKINVSYTPNNSDTGGVLTVDRGRQEVAAINLVGQYTTGNFEIERGPNGTVEIIDPPVEPGSSSASNSKQNAIDMTSFGSSNLLGYLDNAKGFGQSLAGSDGGYANAIALLRNNIAATFATSSAEVHSLGAETLHTAIQHTLLSLPHA